MHRKYALARSVILTHIDTETLRLLLELHDLRDTKTALVEREDAVRGRLLEKYQDDVSLSEKGYGKLDLRVANIKARPGNRRVDMDLLRDKLGEDAEEFIVRGDTQYAIVNLDPSSIEEELDRRNAI